MLEVDICQLERDLVKDLDKFQRELLPKVSKTVLLRVSRTATSRWLRSAARRANVKAGLLRKRAFNKPLRGGGRIVGVSTAPIPLAIMGPKGRIPTQTRRGVRVAGRAFKKGFVATANLGKRPGKQAVFQREGEARGPINEIRVPVKEEIETTAPIEVNKAVRERFPIEMKSQLDRATTALKGARRR